MLACTVSRADRIVDDVGAATTRDPHHVFAKVTLAVEDRVVGTARTRDRRLRRRADRRDHHRAAELRELDQQLPDAARACVHDADVARPHAPRRVRQVMRRRTLQHQRACDVERHVVGNAHASPRRYRGVCRIGTPDDAPCNALPDRESLDLCADGIDRSGALHAEHHGQRCRVRLRARICAVAHVHVHVVDTRACHANAQLPGSGRRHRDITRFQDLGAAEAIDRDCLHYAIGCVAGRARSGSNRSSGSESS